MNDAIQYLISSKTFEDNLHSSPSWSIQDWTLTKTLFGSFLWISGLLISPSWSACQSVIQIKVHASINILVQRVRPFCSLMLGSFWGTETYIKSCCVGCRISMDFFNNSKILLPVFAVRFSHLKVLDTRICASKHFFQELDLAFWPHLVIKQWRCDQINPLCLCEFAIKCYCFSRAVHVCKKTIFYLLFLTKKKGWAWYKLQIWSWDVYLLHGGGLFAV